jgi:hypothetical protein
VLLLNLPFESPVRGGGRSAGYPCNATITSENRIWAKAGWRQDSIAVARLEEVISRTYRDSRRDIDIRRCLPSEPRQNPNLAIRNLIKIIQTFRAQATYTKP